MQDLHPNEITISISHIIYISIYLFYENWTVLMISRLQYLPNRRSDVQYYLAFRLYPTPIQQRIK